MNGTAPIGLGFASLGASEKPPLDDVVTTNIFATALALDINRFDTSPLYGGGQSEERLGKLLQGLPRDKYILSTKVGRYRPFGEILQDQKNNPSDIYDYSADTTKHSIENSLKRLGVDRLDIVYIHDCDNFVKEAAEGAFPALMQLKNEGVIGLIGVGSNNVNTHEAMLDRIDPDILMVANCYSLLTQDAGDHLFSLCQSREIAVELAAPFNSGILATGPENAMTTYRYAAPKPEILERTRQIAVICENHGVPLKRAALQYCAKHSAVDRLILGLVEPENLRSNVADMHVEVPQDLWIALAEIGIPEPKISREVIDIRRQLLSSSDTVSRSNIYVKSAVPTEQIMKTTDYMTLLNETKNRRVK